MNFLKYFILLLPLFLAISCTDQEGCTDVNACNYDADADTNDGSCLTIGATCDDGDSETINDLVSSACVCAGTTSGVCAGGTFSLMMDGTEWAYDDIQFLLVKAELDGVPSKGFVVLATKDSGESLRVTLTSLVEGSEGSCVPVQTYYEDFESAYCVDGESTFTVCEGSDVLYQVSNFEFYTSDIDGAGTANITTCNEAELKISGNFEVFAEGFGSAGEDIVHTVTGNFTNVCFLAP